jgi:hypothetical protein
MRTAAAKIECAMIRLDWLDTTRFLPDAPPQPLPEPIKQRSPSPLPNEPPVAVQIAPELAAMLQHWTPEELASQRRLVRFHKTIADDCMTISCTCVPQADWREGEVAVSCIGRRLDDGSLSDHALTSTDFLRVLEGTYGGVCLRRLTKRQSCSTAR